jgi:hypothetical protein
VFTIRPHFDVCGRWRRVFTVVDRSIPVSIRGRIFMKQSAAKTLGVAALGAAFAAAGAGAANAAPALPDATQALGGVTSTLPAQNVAPALPGAGQTLSQGKGAAGAGLAAAQPAIGKALAHGPAKPVTGLLGGLPVQGLGSSSVNGLPLG